MFFEELLLSQFNHDTQTLATEQHFPWKFHSDMWLILEDILMLLFLIHFLTTFSAF